MKTADEYLKSYGFTPAAQAFDEAAERIRMRKEGLITPYKLKWPRLTKLLGGGLQPSTVYTIGGRPGVGKSSFANDLLFSVCERNDVDDFVILYWTWEMPAYQQLIRGFSGKLGKTVQTLMSADVSLPESLFKQILESREHWASYPIYFMSYAKTPMYIYQLVKGLKKNDTEDKQVINVFDHTRLALRDDNIRSEEEKITQLLKAAHRLSVEEDVINIFLSQLNRNIEQDRRKQPVPQLADFFGADSVAQFSNVAMILNQPSRYQRDDYLKEDIKNLLAVHVLKNRDGDVAWIPFDHDLANNRMEERYPPMNTITYEMK